MRLDEYFIMLKEIVVICESTETKIIFPNPLLASLARLRPDLVSAQTQNLEIATFDINLRFYFTSVGSGARVAGTLG